MPEFIAAGEHMFSGLRYRFMVMHRYGEDIEKKFTAAGRQFGMKTVCYLALRLVSHFELYFCINGSINVISLSLRCQSCTCEWNLWFVSVP